jgi:hypothetical protein
MAERIANGLAEGGWTVLSGAAYGVDAAAHRGALANRGLTVAVLASGIDRPHPAGHADLLDTIAANGVVVSEYPPVKNATRRFLARNMIIAALAIGIVIVEAARRSELGSRCPRPDTSFEPKIVVMPQQQLACVNALLIRSCGGDGQQHTCSDRQGSCHTRSFSSKQEGTGL